MTRFAVGWARSVSLDPALEREFEERVADSSTLAFRVALGVLRHREDAEDVAQDAFLRAHRAFASLRDRDRFRAWLVRTAFRLALDRLRGEKRRARREDAVAIEAPVRTESVEDAAARAEVRARVSEAVDALPEKLRIVTVLAAIQEHDVASVARLLELPEGTVKSRLYLARKSLAERLRWLVSDTGEALADVAAGLPAPAGLEAHLGSCEACREELHVLRQALAVADAEMAGLRPPSRRRSWPFASARRWPRTEPSPAWRFGWLWPAMAAAATLLVALAVVMGRGTPSAPESRVAVDARRPQPTGSARAVEAAGEPVARRPAGTGTDGSPSPRAETAGAGRRWP